MENETEELYAYLSQIVQKSFAGEIAWSQPNPSTFQWVREIDGSPYLVIIQKASSPKSRNIRIGLDLEKEEDTYLFQVQDRKLRQTVMALSSAERPEFSKVLSDIFLGAEKGIDVRSSQVLKKLLG